MERACRWRAGWAVILLTAAGCGHPPAAEPGGGVTEPNGVYVEGEVAAGRGPVVHNFTCVIPKQVGGKLIHLRAREARYLPARTLPPDGGWLLTGAEPARLEGWQHPEVLEAAGDGTYFLHTRVANYDALAGGQTAVPPHEAPAAPATTTASTAATAAPPPIVAAELTGTLQIDAALPQGAVSLATNVIGFAREGWLFLGEGQFVGGLPLRKELRLMPGEYPVRLVATMYGSSYLCYQTYTGRVTVTRGQTTSCKLYSYTAPLDGYKKVQSAVGVDTIFPRMLGAQSGWDAQLAKDRESAESGWRRFSESPEWKATAAAADRLRLAPPSRPRVWVDLPAEAGGPREMDVDQLKFHVRWLLGRLRKEMDQYTGVYPNNESTEAQRERYSEQCDAIRKFHAARTEFVNATVYDIIGVLRKVPAEGE